LRSHLRSDVKTKDGLSSRNVLIIFVYRHQRRLVLTGEHGSRNKISFKRIGKERKQLRRRMKYIVMGKTWSEALKWINQLTSETSVTL
jgi:hypothetical protein